MLKYLSIFVILIGAAILIVTGLTQVESDSNTPLGLGLCLIVLGYLGHIFLNKRLKS